MAIDVRIESEDGSVESEFPDSRANPRSHATASLFLGALVALAAAGCSTRRAGNEGHGSPQSGLHELAIDRDRVAVVLIDAQPSFLDIMHGDREPVVARMEQLLALADVWELPMIATFEHPTERNGWLPERLEKVFPKHGRRFVKRFFNCCLEPEIAQAVRDTGAQQLVVAGAETDVCVLQSVLGLLEMGFQVFVLEDCLFTHERRTEPALQRMRRAGALPCTYKTFHFEITRAIGGSDVSPARRARWQRLRGTIKSPYRLPHSR